MGGKKRTKWRKLPLEEFTKEIPDKSEKVPSKDTCQTDLTKEENNYLPSYNEQAEVAQNYPEPYEYVDGLWYPTSCVVYNPAEVGLYSNYMMPMDNCYYYYTMPEVPQMQEYVTLPYQEYTPALPKDTVYLLLPTQTLRPTQPVQNIVPEWQGRRRRRRYEGCADYAVIPDKPNTSKTSDKDCFKATGQHVNSRRNSYQSNNYRKMSSYTETANFDDFNFSEQSPSCSKSNDPKINSKTHTDMNNLKGPKSLSKEMDFPSNKENGGINLKYKNNLEICGIHSRNTPEKNEQTVTEKINSSLMSSKNEVNPLTDLQAMEKENKEKPSSISDIPNSSLSSKQMCKSSNTPTVITNKSTPQNHSKEQCEGTQNATLPMKGNNESVLPSKSSEQEINLKTKVTPQKQNVDSVTSNAKCNLISEDIRDQSNSPSSLPDILSTLNKSLPNEKIKEPDTSRESPLFDSTDLDKELYPKSKSLLSQTSYLPNFLSSEALHNEMEIELNQLQSLHSLQANQSIYKLAYDENVTDQSEADSRSPSPVDPESQVPSSLTSAEILIHEADSGSDAGSEDVELLPHRYESETFLNENKHVYVNRLSLAVELLRTQESLPYDEEFKRVVGENNLLNDIVPGVHTGGKVNPGFVEDSSSLNTFNIMEPYESKSVSSRINMTDISQLKHSANSSNDSAIFSDIEFDSLEEELSEPAKEAIPETTDTQDNTEEIRAGYRRFGIQARHYLSPRAAISLNPCFCCIIM